VCPSERRLPKLPVLCLVIVTESSRGSTWRDPDQAMRVRADPISCVLLSKSMRDMCA
jgi:hypothetical protein